MNLKTYCEDMGRRVALAKELKTSAMYLWQLANGWRGRRPSPKFAQRIERATRKITPSMVVTKESLRPDLWPVAA